jgi:hypothetical protein
MVNISTSDYIAVDEEHIFVVGAYADGRRPGRLA